MAEPGIVRVNWRVLTHLVVLHLEDVEVVIVGDVDPCLLLADLAEGGDLHLSADHDTVSHLGAHRAFQSEHKTPPRSSLRNVDLTGITLISIDSNRFKLI